MGKSAVNKNISRKYPQALKKAFLKKCFKCNRHHGKYVALQADMKGTAHLDGGALLPFFTNN